jgi:hypothetical protein
LNNNTVDLLPTDESREGQSIEFECRINEKKYRLFFRCTEAVLSGNVESFLAGTILPSMKSGGGNLAVDGEVSRIFLASLSTIQDIYCLWDESLQRVNIQKALAIQRIPSTKKRVGVFFSGGVDSFYTFLKHQDEITDLIFVHGLDIKLTDTPLLSKASKKIREVASAFGVNIIEVETNIRELLDSYVDWGFLGHGATLAAIGHLLYPDFHRIYIAATHTYADLFPWGSHPVLDHLWSSEVLEFVHDGCEATRVKKVALISKHDIALHTLRVCWKNPNSAYNCGQCEKCLRTMVNLKVNDALDRCTTFDCGLDLKRVSKIDIKDENTRSFVRENLKQLEKRQDNEELRKALRTALNRQHWPRKIKVHVKHLAKRFISG